MHDDYLGLKLQHRLARDGEGLVAHRFKTGDIRMVACGDFERWRFAAGARSGKPSTEKRHIWKSICAMGLNCWKDFLSFFGFSERDVSPSDEEPSPIVEIPSDALLRIFDIGPALQKRYHLQPSEDALYIGFSETGAFRNAIIFGNGAIVPLQLLREGQSVKVVYRSWVESLEPRPQRARV